MRKAQKKDILDMIQTLHEAHEEIKNHIDRNNTVSAQDLLAQCQECAVSIGNAIETMEKEDCVTIPYIQDYCDFIYQIYEALQNNTDSNANKIYKNLKKQLLRIENSVKNDIPVRKEVVFFPYKASMWDSLESVYLAAKEDPECDAYCVPIPYYDRNPDRSLGQMHYEGNEYPKNIEITDWQKYNFEERKPDVVYIHNPYDDWNLVTCVHPRFFSSNLKKYTEELVYIPYFVLDEIEPDDQPRIDGMRHFIWTPGVINADKVIVQSEKMKQIYVNEYLKAAQENGLQGNHLDRKYLEEKFLGLGSPKIDKILNTKKEDLEIPEEWLKIIQKPDGSWKKIIFYNTSIAALLENNEKMLEKMKDVFRIFKENKDEVALLWRPHPLIESTISSMKPQLWEEYEKIVKQYKEEDWGIYDDSSDMDRAVVLSDAYYGDGSSVIELYKAASKMYLIQNVNYLSKINSDKFDLWFECYELIEDKIWFPSSNVNGLFACNLINKKVELITKFPEEYYMADRLFSAMCRVDDMLFFSPQTAKSIAVYNIKTREHISCRLPKIKDINLNDEDKFQIIIRYNEWVYLISLYGCVIKLNLKDFKCTCVFDEPFFTHSRGKIDWIGENYVRINDIIYANVRNSNQVYIFDIKNETRRLLKIPIVNLKLNFSCLCKDKIIMGGRGVIIETNYNLDRYNVIYKNDSCNFIDGYYTGNYLYISDSISNNIYYLNSDTNEIIPIHTVKKNGKNARWDYKLFLKYNGDVNFFDNRQGEIYIEKNGIYHTINLMIDEKYIFGNKGEYNDALKVLKRKKTSLEGVTNCFSLKNWLNALIAYK